MRSHNLLTKFVRILYRQLFFLSNGISNVKNSYGWWSSLGGILYYNECGFVLQPAPTHAIPTFCWHTRRSTPRKRSKCQTSLTRSNNLSPVPYLWRIYGKQVKWVLQVLDKHTTWAKFQCDHCDHTLTTHFTHTRLKTHMPNVGATHKWHKACGMVITPLSAHATTASAAVCPYSPRWILWLLQFQLLELVECTMITVCREMYCRQRYYGISMFTHTNQDNCKTVAE